MVWMVTLIGFTFGIPDSIMGITFLAAGTSVPDAYASLHVAKLGQADMAVSNSIGSNVFDILVGLALPWFVETAIVSPGAVSKINSRGLVYAVILLFLSLVITVYLFHRYRWTLCPSLGYALLSTYAAFLVFSSALEFNLFGKCFCLLCCYQSLTVCFLVLVQVTSIRRCVTSKAFLFNLISNSVPFSFFLSFSLETFSSTTLFCFLCLPLCLRVFGLFKPDSNSN